MEFHSTSLHQNRKDCVWRIQGGGFGVSRVAGLAKFSPQVSGFTSKSYGFPGFEICRGLQVWLFFVLRFRVFHSKFLFRRVFRVIQSI